MYKRRGLCTASVLSKKEGVRRGARLPFWIYLRLFRPVSAPLFPGQQHQRCAAQQQSCAPQNHIALIAGLDAGIFGLSGLFGLIVRVLRAADGALAVLIVVALGGDHLTPGQQLAAHGAIGVAGIAVMGAAGVLGVPQLRGVAGGGDLRASGHDDAAVGALHAGGHAGLGAGGRRAGR